MFEFHVLTMGYFSRNMFWGESDDISYRDAICTSTLIKAEANIIVDPSLAPQVMAETLFNRSGLRPDAIGFVFLTHEHGDHYAGLDCFPGAEWYMSETSLAAMRANGDAAAREYARKIKPAYADFVKGVDLLPLPGHTPGTCAVVFDSADGRVAVCGDAVMSRDFFKARKGYRNSMDFEKASASIELLAKSADIVVPGHDNYFYIQTKL